MRTTEPYENSRTDTADPVPRNSLHVRIRAHLMGTNDIERQLRQTWTEQEIEHEYIATD